MSSALAAVSGGVGPHAGLPMVTGGAALANAEGALVVLHGRGGRAADLMSVAALVAGPRFALFGPEAHHHTWYPQRFDDSEEANQPFLASAISVVHDLVARLVAHVPPNRITLLGFSQGACLALECAGQSSTALGGAIAFSGGLIGARLEPNRYLRRDRMRVYLSCAEQDPHIPIERVIQSAELLRQLGADVIAELYAGGEHGIRNIDIEKAARILAPFASSE